MKIIHLPWIFLSEVSAFWDYGSTTLGDQRRVIGTRDCRFRWMASENSQVMMFFPWWDWNELLFRKRLFVFAGISHEMLNLSTAIILNRRVLITAANYLDPYMDRQSQLRIWALGKAGQHNTPFRYRVWRVSRIFPRSVNPEHVHGPWGYHSPRHDIAVIHSLDQMFVYHMPPQAFHYAFRGYIPHKHRVILKNDDIWFGGSGYERFSHIVENYEIVYTALPAELVVDCSKYLPKWWGKFICFKNVYGLAGVQNGGGLFDGEFVIGVGSFEIRYNEDRIMAFTDFRFYIYQIFQLADILPGEYYEYAYPQWSVFLTWHKEDETPGPNAPYIPIWQARDDIYPMGRKK